MSALSAAEFSRIRIEVVALRDDVLVHLLRALGGDQHVDPELAPLGRDPDRVLGGERGERVAGHGRADVVRLVDDEQHRLPLGAAIPETAQHGLGDQRLLLARRRASRGPPPGSARRDRRARSAPSRRPRAPRRPSPRRRGCGCEAAGGAPRRRSAAASSARLSGRCSTSSAASSAYSSRSATGSSRSTAPWLADPARGTAAAGARRRRTLAERTAIPPASASQRSRRLRVGAVAHLGQARRSRSWGRGSRCAGRSRAAAARARRRASSSCPSPTGRTGTCGGRSRRRRG